uniref:Uncharacterized protein n=1 Tax=Anas zonorhyncha TaxID=75864 RepID=A0A8B9V622_9AVES
VPSTVAIPDTSCSASCGIRSRVTRAQWAPRGGNQHTAPGRAHHLLQLTSLGSREMKSLWNCGSMTCIMYLICEGSQRSMSSSRASSFSGHIVCTHGRPSQAPCLPMPTPTPAGTPSGTGAPEP